MNLEPPLDDPEIPDEDEAEAAARALDDYEADAYDRWRDDNLTDAIGA